MRSSSPLRILTLTTLLVAAATGLLLVSTPAHATPAHATPAHADPATVPAAGVWPLDPRPDVQAGFDPPQSSWGAGHRGVDLTGHLGQRVRAAEPGRVTFAGTLAGRGVVVVDHGGTRTTYEPVTASVAVGDTVGAGAALGRLELFGSHCFPRACLHWGLIEGRDHYLDPLTLVGAGPIRLLPFTGGLDPLVGLPERAIPDVRAAAPVSGPRMRLAEGLP